MMVALSGENMTLPGVTLSQRLRALDVDQAVYELRCSQALLTAVLVGRLVRRG
jgi:hypothetical protein